MDLCAEALRYKPVLPELPSLRESALATWRGRMVNEYSSSRVFEGLASQLARADLPEAEVQACRGFSDEEKRHGVLCGAVVMALGGDATFELRKEEPYPEHGHVPTEEAALYNLMSICCMNETVAVSLIGAERLEMPEGALRDLLTSIYADEVGHSRFGWRLMPLLVERLTPDAFSRANDYLRIAFAALEEHQLANLNVTRAPPPEGAAYGLCNGHDARALFYATVESAIIPGLERLGLDAALAWQHRHGTASSCRSGAC